MSWSLKPMNVLLCTMLIAIVISGAIIFMMMCPSPIDGIPGWGALRFDSGGKSTMWNCTSEIKSTKFVEVCEMVSGGKQWNEWMEINSQLMNGLFTLGAAINFPSRLGEAYLLYLTTAKAELHALNNFFPRSYDIKQRKIVVFFLLLNCLGQIPITCAHWFFHSSFRPKWVVPVFLPVCFGSAVIAAILNRKYSNDTSKEFQTVVEMEVL
jgi:hypothetical protein